MASVEGNYPDQSWAHSLPGFFKENVKPCLNEKSFLIPRENVVVPTIVTKSTVGMVNNRGFIDVAPSRTNTTRNFIINPSTYIARLHPHDLTAGTGGIDNLSNLYRFGQPTPFSNALDFADVQYWGSRELAKERLDPLSNGYASKVLGPDGINLQLQMRSDQATAAQREAYRAQMRTLESQRYEEQIRAYNEANAATDRRALFKRRQLAQKRSAEAQPEEKPTNKRQRTDEEMLDADINGEDMGEEEMKTEEEPSPEDTEDFQDAYEDINAESVETNVPEEPRPSESASATAASASASASTSASAAASGSMTADAHLALMNELNAKARYQYFRTRFDPLESMYSNAFTPEPETKKVRNFSSYLLPTRIAGANQNQTDADNLDRTSDPQLRAFMGKRSTAANVSVNPDADAAASQINQNITATNHNLNDGNYTTPQEAVGQGGSDVRPDAVPLSGVNRPVAVDPTLSGNVYNLRPRSPRGVAAPSKSAQKVMQSMRTPTPSQTQTQKQLRSGINEALKQAYKNNLSRMNGKKATYSSF